MEIASSISQRGRGKLAELAGWLLETLQKPARWDHPTDLDIFFLDLDPRLSAARAKTFFVFGCDRWYDREIVLLPPHYVNTTYREGDYQPALPQGRKSSRRV